MKFDEMFNFFYFFVETKNTLFGIWVSWTVTISLIYIPNQNQKYNFIFNFFNVM